MAVDPWKALLNMSTKLTAEEGKSEESESDSSKKEMKQEDLEFLQKALLGEQKEGPSMIDKFMIYGNFDPKILANEQKLIDGATKLAEQLEDFFIMGNYADQFGTEKGLQALQNLTTSPSFDLQNVYLRLIPLIAENNLPIQSLISNSSLFLSFITLITDFQSIHRDNLFSLLSAISSIIRGCPAAWNQFVKVGGVSKLMKLIQETQDHKIGAKAAHLLYSAHTSNIPDISGVISATTRVELERTIIMAYIQMGRLEESTVLTTKRDKKFLQERKDEMENLVLTFENSEKCPKKERVMDKETEEALKQFISTTKTKNKDTVAKYYGIN